MIGRGVLSQCRGWSFQNFPWDANYKTNDPGIVKFSMSMFGAGNNWMARCVLRQSRGSLRKICQRSSYQYSSNIQVGHWQIRDPRSLLSQSKLHLLKLKEFRGAATQQKIATELSKSKFNTGKNLIVRCILGKSRGRVLKNFPGGFAPDSCTLFALPLWYVFIRFYQLLLNTDLSLSTFKDQDPIYVRSSSKIRQTKAFLLTRKISKNFVGLLLCKKLLQNYQNPNSIPVKIWS